MHDETKPSSKLQPIHDPAITDEMLAPTAEEIHHARYGPDVKRPGAAAMLLGSAMNVVGRVLEPSKQEESTFQVQAEGDDAGDDDLLKRISFGDKDPLW